MTDNHISPKRRNNSLTGLAILYFTGVLAGTVMYCAMNSERVEILDNITGNFISVRLGQSFSEMLISSFSGSFILLLICFLLGFSAIAQPAELLVPVFQGLGAGVSIAGMYSSYGLSGIGISAVLVVPNAVISAFAVIIAVREAINLSSEIYYCAFGREQSAESLDFRLYFTKFVILCAMLTAASLAESLVTFLFEDFWVSLLGV